MGVGEPLQSLEAHESGSHPHPHNVVSEFFTSAYMSGVERPLAGLSQLVGCDVKVSQAPDDLHGMIKVANIAGSAAGSIGDFVLLSKLVGKGISSISGTTAEAVRAGALLDATAANQGLLNAGVTGFLNGSVFTATPDGESKWRRLGQGVVDAGSFMTMGAIAGHYANELPNNIIGRISTNALAGAGAGVVDANLDAWAHGRLAGIQDDLSSATGWATGNIIFGEAAHGVAKVASQFSPPAVTIGLVDSPTLSPSVSREGQFGQGLLPNALAGKPLADSMVFDRSPDVNQVAPTDLNTVPGARRPPRVWTILAIDGGGIRGTIPAEFLARLEARTGLHITDMFDLITGTSTGGILTAGLTKPGADGRPQYSAADMVNLYEKEGANIFHTNFWIQAKSWIFGGPKYPAEGIDTALQKYFGNAVYKDQIGMVMIPAVETVTRQPWFFKNWDADDGTMLTRDVARATSAAPSYFDPVRFKNNGALVDGGLNANDPAGTGLAEALRMAQDGDEFVVVSLGTGKYTKPYTYEAMKKFRPFQWLQPSLDLLFDGQQAVTNYELDKVFKLVPASLQGRVSNVRGFYRFQTNLDAASEPMDNATPANIQKLKAYGDRIVDVEQTDDFEHLANELLSIRQAKLLSNQLSVATSGDASKAPPALESGAAASAFAGAALSGGEDVKPKK